jgi:prepilin-type N-terminal cleavage/methylation domain-containing protein
MNQSDQGFSLVELMVVLALGIIVLASLSHLLIVSHQNHLQQQIQQELYNEANIAAQYLQQNISQTRAIACSDHHLVTTNLSSQIIATPNGIQVYSSNDSVVTGLLSSTIRKKLLVNSSVIVIESIASPQVAANLVRPNQLSSQESLAATSDDVLLLHNCQQAWLLKIMRVYHHNHATEIYLPHAIPALITPLSLAIWQQTIWFIMKNSQGGFGLYRLQKPQEKSPVEIASHMAGLDIQILTKQNIASWQWQKSNSSVEWQNVVALRIMLALNYSKQSIQWPISIILHAP